MTTRVDCVRGATIYVGHVLDTLREMPDASVQCCVTSPPYWGLRDYGTAPSLWPAVEYRPMAGLAPITVPEMTANLGNETTPEAFIAHLVHVFREVRRVLADDGVLWLNLGDSFAGAGSSGSRITTGLQKSSAAKWTSHNKTKRTVKIDVPSKSLLGIPWRAAFALQADGWYLRMDNIWHKPNPMPESVTDRPTKAHEYMFLLAKSERYYYDAEAVKEPVAKEGRNRRSVWTIATKPYRGAHFATFPPALVEPCILAGSRVGDLVLDPFAGSGTTGAVASQHGRVFLGCELNPEYAELARQRIAHAETEAAKPKRATKPRKPHAAKPELARELEAPTRAGQLALRLVG